MSAANPHPVGADAGNLPLARVIVLLPLGRGNDEDGRLLHVELPGVDAAVTLDGALEEVKLGQHLVTTGNIWSPFHYLPISMLSATHCSPTLYGLILSFSIRAACPATSFAITVGKAFK